MVARVLQVSDMHAVREAGGLAYGYDADANLRDVLAAGRTEGGSFDLVLATGDVADDASPEAYRRVRAALGPSGRHVRWLPGNHDAPRRMADADPRGADPLDLDGWRVIPVDSRWPGEVAGLVGDAALGALAGELSRAGDRHCLVAIHHPPWSPCAAANCQLTNRDGVLDVIRTAGNVRAVVSGHLHHAFELHRDGISWIGAPSTCFQTGHPGHDATADPPAAHALDLLPDGSVRASTLRAAD